jgi:hypothetical protein
MPEVGKLNVAAGAKHGYVACALQIGREADPELRGNGRDGAISRTRIAIANVRRLRWHCDRPPEGYDRSRYPLFSYDSKAPCGSSGLAMADIKTLILLQKYRNNAA